MTTLVLDASAVLATLFDEPGGEVALAAKDAAISAINFAEVISKLLARGLPESDAFAAARSFRMEVVPTDVVQAELAGVLHARTRQRGISMGDAFCLALAATLGVPAVTGERRWSALDLGVELTLIR